MYIYNVGYHSYEESDYIQLSHEKKFSKDKFEEAIIGASVNVLKRTKIHKGERLTFQDILYDVIEELIKNFGFEKIEFTSEFNVFGWADIMDEKDWERDRDEQLNKLTKKIKFNYPKK